MRVRRAGFRWIMGVSLSYALVFLIPFAVFMATSLVYVSRSAQAEIDSYVSKNLARSRTLLDSEILRMMAIGHSVRTWIDVRFVLDLASPEDILTVERQLLRMVEATPFVTDIVYYDTNTPALVGSRTVYTPETLQRLYSNEELISPYAFHQALVTTRDARFILLNRSESGRPPFLFFAYPVALYSNPRAYLIFIIPSDNVARRMAGDATPEAVTMLYDSNERLVYPAPQLGPYGRRMLEGEAVPAGYTRYADRSNETGYTLVRLRPDVDPLGSHPAVLLFGMMSLGLLIVGCLLLYIAFRSYLRPIVLLFREIRQSGTINGGDIAVIRDTITGYRQTLDAQRATHALLRHLFSTRTESLESFLETLEPFQFYEPDYAYGVLLLRYDSRPDGADPDALLSRASNREGRTISLRDPKHPWIIVLLKTRSPHHETVLGELDHLVGSGDAAGAAGTFSPDLTRLPQSLREAERAIAHAVFYQKHAVAAETLSRTDLPTAALLHGAEDLSDAIGRADSGTAARACTRLVSEVRTSEPPPHVVRAIFWEISLKARGAGVADKLISGDAPPTLTEFSEALHRIADASANAPGTTASLSERLRRRIETTFDSPAFSLTALVEQEGCSSSQASTVFKREIGETIGQYASRLRIEKAKRLLSSGHQVKEVVGLVGYTDPTSFIRKFRSHTGVTPREWAEAQRASGGAAIQASHDVQSDASSSTG